MTEIIECEQGSPEWFEARLGIPTASEFSTVLAQGGRDGHLPQNIMDSMVKSNCSAEQIAAAVKAAKRKYGNSSALRRAYMRKLAGEIVTGEAMESYTNPHMERGKVMEDEARQLYAFAHEAEPQQVGFIRSGNAGASPDSLIGDAGALEIKTALPHILIEKIEADKFPPEHKAQCQGVLWVGEREWIDLIVYWPGMPLFEKRAYRDEDYIKTLADAVNRFNDELAALVERVRRYGAPAPQTQEAA